MPDDGWQKPMTIFAGLQPVSLFPAGGGKSPESLFTPQREAIKENP